MELLNPALMSGTRAQERVPRPNPSLPSAASARGAKRAPRELMVPSPSQLTQPRGSPGTFLP